MKGTWVWRGQWYGGDMGMGEDKGMKGTWVRRGQGYGGDKGMKGTRV